MNLLYSKQPTKRQLSVASSIQEVIANAFVKKEIYHPNLDDVIFVFPFAKITADLKIATIYVNCFEKDKLKFVLEALNSSSIEIKKLIANKLKLRYIPEIRFLIDNITEKQDILLKLIKQIP